MYKKLITAFLIGMMSTIAVGQTTKKFDNSGSINEQFDFMISKSNRYQHYKVVELNWLQQMQKNVQDTLALSVTTIAERDASLKKQQTEIANLNTSLTTANGEIETLSGKIESISFLGIDLQKPVFKTLMFTIIGILALLLAFFVFQYKRSNAVTVESKATIKELEEEFDQHRKRALEREQKVMRRLQDELNKQKKDK